MVFRQEVVVDCQVMDLPFYLIWVCHRGLAGMQDFNS